MTRLSTILLLLSLSSIYPLQARTNPWELATSIYQGQVAAIGGYANGCLSGAQPLPLTGDGYQVIRSQRQRFYGHPNLVNFVSHYSKQLTQQGINNIFIGDMSMPRGGQFDFGHSSHQIGLDVDIWLKLTEAPLKPQELQNPRHLSVVDIDKLTVNQAWSKQHKTMLKVAAENNQVARIFVNPIIKQQLCNERSDKDTWLQKIRPWWGHTSHMHVRLHCPETDSLCKAQQPIKSGHGCEELTWWTQQLKRAAASQQQAKQPKTAAAPKPKPLKQKPLSCEPLVKNLQAKQ
ncbi:penicillin-insensitive murein endopeptidase [Shewanella sp. 5_MG-2023]|uniref:penicillin-insensitive murein endopeptidase n=1 Tax=Shewanella sp. 5_MG-2023 TaxID=3062656 RepID=UPI0026E43A91|nr:penicillin-insensitive murein endopeptidase [Shewanella sp. 5_MG-2023]MDO6638496.1 penicillin-insensitive murein endopeptidase [Shewanella sp. 5_MG-2023]